MDELPSSRWPSPKRRRKSISVTMRPRRLSTPAISGGASGTRVSRSGMKTSCTRTIGNPNNWPPIMAVTYSVKFCWAFSVFMVCSSRRATDVGLFLERRDQPLPVEFGDIVVEADLAAALDRFGRYDRGQRDDRHIGGAWIAAQAFREFEPAHLGHLNIGDDHVEDAPVLEHRQGFRRRCGGGHLVAGGLQHRREHVAEERRVVDQQQRARPRAFCLIFIAEPILEGERQEVADVDDFGGLPLDDGGAEYAGIFAADLNVETILDDVDDLVDHQRH